MSLYKQMRRDNPRMFDIEALSKPPPKSHLLDDIKKGKKPEKKHITLDKFIK